MTSPNDNQLRETGMQRRLRRLKSSIRKRTSAAYFKGWVSITNSTYTRLMASVTGRVRCHGSVFDLRHPRMIDSIRHALEKGTYEECEIAMIDRFIRNEDRVVELGACLGATSMFLCDRVGADRLVVYEADPRNLEMAQHNFLINKMNIRCENAILWSGPDRPKTVSFGSNENPSSSSLLERKGNKTTFEIPTRDFEAVLQEHEATAIVLDIEGGEVELFNNAGDLNGIRIILMEAHERIVGAETNREMLETLKARGFEIVENLSNQFVVLARS